MGPRLAPPAAAPEPGLVPQVKFQMPAGSPGLWGCSRAPFYSRIPLPDTSPHLLRAGCWGPSFQVLRCLGEEVDITQNPRDWA